MFRKILIISLIMVIYPFLVQCQLLSNDDFSILLVAENAAKCVLVPTADIGNIWTGGQVFDDSTWISGIGGVGYETQSGYENFFDIDVETQMYGENKNNTCYIRIPNR